MLSQQDLRGVSRLISYVLVVLLVVVGINNHAAGALCNDPLSAPAEGDPWWMVALTIVGAVGAVVYIAEKVHENTTTAEAHAEAQADENKRPADGAVYPPQQMAHADTATIRGIEGSTARAIITATNGFSDFTRAYDTQGTAANPARNNENASAKAFVRGDTRSASEFVYVTPAPSLGSAPPDTAMVRLDFVFTGDTGVALAGLSDQALTGDYFSADVSVSFEERSSGNSVFSFVWGFTAEIDMNGDFVISDQRGSFDPSHLSLDMQENSVTSISIPTVSFDAPVNVELLQSSGAQFEVYGVGIPEPAAALLLLGGVLVRRVNRCRG